MFWRYRVLCPLALCCLPVSSHNIQMASCLGDALQCSRDMMQCSNGIFAVFCRSLQCSGNAMHETELFSATNM